MNSLSDSVTSKLAQVAARFDASRRMAIVPATFTYIVKTRIKKTRVLGVQADFVLIYWVFSAKSA